MKTPAAAPMFAIGLDLDGRWTVSDAAGALLGRFDKSASAIRFARRRQRMLPSTSIADAAADRPRLHGRLSLATVRSGKDRNDA